MSSPSEPSASRTLLLIRHAQPTIQPSLPAREWALSPEGRLQAQTLALQLAAYTPAVVITSDEPKARETGVILARECGLPLAEDADLGEHRREPTPFLGRDEFENRIRRLFAEPDALILGEETATQATKRFSSAIDRALAAYPLGDIAVITHGTVLTLFVVRHNAIEPFTFWRSLAMPDLVALSLPVVALIAPPTLQ